MVFGWFAKLSGGCGEGVGKLSGVCGVAVWRIWEDL